mmetsp:Transcript_13463/g.36255  ORF Transcript_13463/g.36255 Transcript_13463/m.36255 type:complete len:216 (-) Transcript_13463:642-1289(-)
MPTDQHHSRSPCVVPRQPFPRSWTAASRPCVREAVQTASANKNTSRPKFGAKRAEVANTNCRTSPSAAQRSSMRRSPVLSTAWSTACPPTQDAKTPVKPNTTPSTTPTVWASTPWRRSARAAMKRWFPDISPLSKAPSISSNSEGKRKSRRKSPTHVRVGGATAPVGRTVVTRSRATKSCGDPTPQKAHRHPTCVIMRPPAASPTSPPAAHPALK